MLARASLLVPLIATVAACTGDTTAPPAVDTQIERSTAVGGGPTTGSPTPTGSEADQGLLGLDAALSLFAAGYAPLPGVEPAAAAPVDGGPAVRALLADLDDLGTEQRAVVARVVAPAGRPVDEIASDRGANARLRAAARIVRAALDAFGGERGRPLSDDVEVTLVALRYTNADGTHNFSALRSTATAIPFGDGEQPYAECRIRVNVDHPLDRRTRFADPAFVSGIAHEAFHCLQYEVVPFAAAPQWVVEGAAAYAGEDFAGGSDASAEWWTRWIRQPQRPLSERAQDAIGFFALLASATNPYTFADALLTDPSVESLRRRLEASSVFDRWGLEYATEPRWGQRYRMTGPGAPVAMRAPRTTVELRVDRPPVIAGGSTGLTAAPVEVAVPGDVLVVTADPGDRGGLRFGDGQETALADATQAYCVRPGGCKCPGRRRNSAPATVVDSDRLFIGVGPSSGGGPSLAARSLGQWCQEVLVPPPPANALDQCLVRTWTTRAYVAPGVSGARQTVSGGAGASIEFRADRTVKVDMNATSAAVIALTGPNGVTVTTTIEYRGAGTGTWSADGRVVNVAGVDPSSFTVRVRVKSSAQGLLADATLPATDVRLAGIAGLLGTARYECTAGSLGLTRVVPGVGGEAGFELAPD